MMGERRVSENDVVQAVARLHVQDHVLPDRVTLSTEDWLRLAALADEANRSGPAFFVGGLRCAVSPCLPPGLALMIDSPGLRDAVRRGDDPTRFVVLARLYEPADG